MLTEFKEFVEKFNVIPVAVALVLALAFAPVVESLVNVILSLVGKIGGLDQDFSSWEPGDIPLGSFITATLAFLLMAFVVFLLVKSLRKAGMATEMGPTAEVPILEDIRDELKARN